MQLRTALYPGNHNQHTHVLKRSLYNHQMLAGHLHQQVLLPFHLTPAAQTFSKVGDMRTTGSPSGSSAMPCLHRDSTTAARKASFYCLPHANMISACSPKACLLQGVLFAPACADTRPSHRHTQTHSFTACKSIKPMHVACRAPERCADMCGTGARDMYTAPGKCKPCTLHQQAAS